MLGTLYINWDKFELSEMFISVQDFYWWSGDKKKKNPQNRLNQENKNKNLSEKH